MATKQMNVSLTPELKASIDDRVKSGQYGNASDVVRAGLRALAREEMALSIAEFDKIMSDLPQDPITPEIEQQIEQEIKRLRAQDKKKQHRA